jgi:hypothetical protein
VQEQEYMIDLYKQALGMIEGPGESADDDSDQAAF